MGVPSNIKNLLTETNIISNINCNWQIKIKNKIHKKRTYCVLGIMQNKSGGKTIKIISAHEKSTGKQGRQASKSNNYLIWYMLKQNARETEKS